MFIKKALTEIRESSSSESSEVINGKKKSAIVASDSYKKNGKGARVTVADTNKTKPLTILEKIAKKEKLEKGDILLVSSRVSNPIGGIFTAGSTAAQGGLNHAAMYVGNGNIIEGRIGEGVTKKKLSAGTKGLSYTVVRPNLPRRVRRKAARVAKKQLGKEYSSSDVLYTGAYLGLVPDGLRSKLLKSGKEDIENTVAMQCAALIAGSYAKAGKNITGTDFRYVAPVDLLSKTDSTIIKMKKAKGDTTQGTPFTFTASAEKAKEKIKEFMNKTASAGCLNMFCHVDATDWCPHGDVVQMLSQFFTKEVNIEIYPRYLVNTVWEKDHPCETYDKDYYAFRAYAGKDYCKIFVDETETKDSVLWVMLHELAHIALASSPFLFKGYRHLTPDDYHCSDEAHERDPEEQMANSIAMSWMDMLGYGRVNYPRHWWRERTMMNKKANIRKRISDFTDTLRGKNVDKAKDNLSGATQDMYDRLAELRKHQDAYADIGDGSTDAFQRQMAAADMLHGDPDSLNVFSEMYNMKPKKIELPENLKTLQDAVVDAQKATDKARMQAALGVGAVSTPTLLGAGYLAGQQQQQQQVPGTTKLASVTTNYPYLRKYRGR